MPEPKRDDLLANGGPLPLPGHNATSGSETRLQFITCMSDCPISRVVTPACAARPLLDFVTAHATAVGRAMCNTASAGPATSARDAIASTWRSAAAREPVHAAFGSCDPGGGKL